MAPFTLVAAALLGLSAQAMALVPVPRDLAIETFTDELVDMNPVSRNTSNVVSHHPVLAARNVEDPDAKSLVKRDAIDCIRPDSRGSGDVEDCTALCTEFQLFGVGAAVIESHKIRRWEKGNCKLGLLNLSCSTQIFPFQRIGTWCSAMNRQCVVDGYDAFFEWPSQKAAAALTGTRAAPPYFAAPC